MEAHSTLLLHSLKESQIQALGTVHIAEQQTMPTPRQTIKQASASAQRRAMNERRQKRTQTIRKQKKSDWLAQKRGIPIRDDDGASSNSCFHQKSAVAIDLSQSITKFRQRPPTPETLHQLLVGLQSASVAPTPWTLDDSTRLEQAKQLVQRLGETLQHCITSNNLKGSLGTVRALLQLVAMSVSLSKSTESDYYGFKPPTWSELIVGETRILTCLPLLISLPQSPTEDYLQIAEQTNWFIGNLTKELPASSICLRRQQQQDGNPAVVENLVKLMNLIQQHEQASTNLQYLVVIQSSLWAFANLLKGDSTASGWIYYQAGLNELFSQLLTVSVPAASSQLENTCIDVAVQAAWILVHLSQREDAVVEALLQTGPDLMRNLLERLFQVCDGAQQQASGGPISPGRPNYFHHPLLEPVLEVLGHWATAGNGKFVPRLLSATPATTRVSHELSLIPIFQNLYQWSHQGLIQINDYICLIWVTGACLCDAGIQNHPSTTLAAPALIPRLSISLQEHENTMTNRINSLECKREAAISLWNALAVPPSEDDEPGMPRDVFLALLQLVLSGGNQATNKNGYSTIMALTKLLSSPDVDAMFASLQIIDALLRNVPSTRVTFMEVDGEEALDAICDLPLGNDKTSSSAADVAAELVDFLVGDDQFDDPVLQPATAGGTFVFGLQDTASAPAPNFLPDLQSDVGGGSMLAPVASVTPAGSGMGRGRGRGHTLPAWAVQQQSQR